MGIVIAIVCIFIFFAFIGDFRKDREHEELVDTIKSTKSSEGNQERFPCPSCAEMVLVQANVCRYCGRDLPEDVKPEILTPPAPAPASGSDHWLFPSDPNFRWGSRNAAKLIVRWVLVVFGVLIIWGVIASFIEMIVS